ncbi:hypothetical protein BH09ACT8_BH09ACT8_44720 [soil metagenome]
MVDEDADREETRRYTVKWQSIVAIARTIIVAACVPFTVWLGTPLVESLAGKDTNLTVSIGASIALTFSTSAVGLWGNQQRKRANAARARNGQLERGNKILIEERDSLRRRLGDLEGPRSEGRRKQKHTKP